MDPKTGNMGSTIGQHGPQIGQHGPNIGQHGPNIGQHGPLTRPRWVQQRYKIAEWGQDGQDGARRSVFLVFWEARRTKSSPQWRRKWGQNVPKIDQQMDQTFVGFVDRSELWIFHPWCSKMGANIERSWHRNRDQNGHQLKHA